MSVPRSLLLGAAIAVATQACDARSAGAQTALEIVDRVDRLMRGESSRARVTMEILTENWSRTLDLEIWSLGTEYSLIRLLAPPKEAGTATLMADEEVWNYLPRVDRTIKVPPSLMMGSWMGSHFTNDDLVKEGRLIEDYDIEIGFEGDRDGTEVWELELTPKPEAPVVWGHISWRVRKPDLMPIWARYYDEDGGLERTMRFDEYREFDGRRVPARMVVEPADKPSETTTVLYGELAFDLGLQPDFFSLRNLRRRR